MEKESRKHPASRKEIVVEINLTDKVFYTFLIVLTILCLAIGIFAVNPGHTISEIDWGSTIALLRANTIEAASVNIGTLGVKESLEINANRVDTEELCVGGTCRTAWPSINHISCSFSGTKTFDFNPLDLSITCGSGKVISLS